MKTYDSSTIDWVDPYYELADTGIERFLLFISDSILDLEVNGKQLEPDYLVLSTEFALQYLLVCYEEESTRSITKRYIRKIKKLIRKRKTALVDTYKYILQDYLGSC